jgi:hypothetical protein
MHGTQELIMHPEQHCRKKLWDIFYFNTQCQKGNGTSRYSPSCYLVNERNHFDLSTSSEFDLF